MQETLDSVGTTSSRNFQIGKYLKDGFVLLRKRFFYLYIVSFMLAGFSIMAQGVLSWYWSLVIPIFLYPILYASFYGLANGARLQDFLANDDFFIGIERFASLGFVRFVQNFLQFLLIIPIMLIFSPLKSFFTYYLHQEVSNETFLAPAIIFIILLLFFLVIYIFTDQFILFKKQNYWKAMTSSRKLVMAHFGKVLLMLLVILFISLFVIVVVFSFYLYIQFRHNFSRGSFIEFLKHYNEFSVEYAPFVAAFIGIICLTYPYAYCVLHAAFADMEELPTEIVWETEPS